MKVTKSVMRKSKEDEQTLAKLNSAHRRSQRQTELNCSCLHHIIIILLTELSRSVWKNFDLGRVYKPHRVQSVLTTAFGQDSPIQTSYLVNKS